MARGIEVRLAKLEKEAGATDLSRLSDEQLEARLQSIVSQLAATPEGLAELRVLEARYGHEFSAALADGHWICRS